VGKHNKVSTDIHYEVQSQAIAKPVALHGHNTLMRLTQTRRVGTCHQGLKEQMPVCPFSIAHCDCVAWMEVPASNGQDLAMMAHVTKRGTDGLMLML
jgi:hypothetical protein